MYEESLIEQLRESKVDLVVSLPCDKNKRFTDIVHRELRTVDITKEEDAVGISAGAYMGGLRPIVSIQSSGLGNMMNAMMSLSDCYGLPLVVLASWRGVDDEKIEAQKHFNLRIPGMLDVFGIGRLDISGPEDLGSVSAAIDSAFDDGRMLVILLHPKLWGVSERMDVIYPQRERTASIAGKKEIRGIKLTRLEAIGKVMEAIDDDTVVVSNIGVPSKETYASCDRDLNFYMMGSFGQASHIGLGLALAVKRKVVVIDGEGSLLTDNILPVIGSIRPDNLTVVCMDNGTYGSTGNQINAGYVSADIGFIAMASGIENVFHTVDGSELGTILSSNRNSFVQFYVKPGNSKSPNIALEATEIKRRFMDALRNDKHCRRGTGQA